MSAITVRGFQTVLWAKMGNYSCLPNNIISRHYFQTIFFINISSLRGSILGYKSSLWGLVFMFWSDLSWYFFHMATTWKSSLRDSIYIYITFTIKEKILAFTPSHLNNKENIIFDNNNHNDNSNVSIDFFEFFSDLSYSENMCLLRKKKKVAVRSEWVASDRRGTMGGWVSS